MKFFILFLFCCFDGLTYCASIPDDVKRYEGDSSNKSDNIDYSNEDSEDQSIEKQGENQGSVPDMSAIRLLPLDFPKNVSKFVGESVHFDCGFDLNRSQIRSISWWKHKDNRHPEIVSSEDNRIYTSVIENNNQFRLRLNIKEIEKADASNYFCDAVTLADSQWQRLTVRLIVCNREGGQFSCC